MYGVNVYCWILLESESCWMFYPCGTQWNVCRGVVSRPDPRWEHIVVVALCRGKARTSVRTRRWRLLIL